MERFGSPQTDFGMYSGGGGLMRLIMKIHIWLNSDKNNKPALDYLRTLVIMLVVVDTNLLQTITNTYNVLWHIFCTKIICKCHNTDRNVWHSERFPLQAQ